MALSAVMWVDLQCVIVAFPGHTYYLSQSGLGALWTLSLSNSLATHFSSTVIPSFENGSEFVSRVGGNTT